MDNGEDRKAPLPDIIVKWDHNGAGHELVWLGDSMLLDRQGRKHRYGSTRFAVVICNDCDCEFWALLNPEVIVASAIGGITNQQENDGI